MFYDLFRTYQKKILFYKREDERKRQKTWQVIAMIVLTVGVVGFVLTAFISKEKVAWSILSYMVILFGLVFLALGTRKISEKERFDKWDEEYFKSKYTRMTEMLSDAAYHPDDDEWLKSVSEIARSKSDQYNTSTTLQIAVSVVSSTIGAPLLTVLLTKLFEKTGFIESINRVILVGFCVLIALIVIWYLVKLFRDFNSRNYSEDFLSMANDFDEYRLLRDKNQ